MSAASVLVATPHPAFGELIRNSLEENGHYRVHVTHSAREARAVSLHSLFQIAILDSALADEPFVPLCIDLLKQLKDLRLIVVPPENNPNHPDLGGLLPHGYLNRPFYLPDLLETVEKLAKQPQPPTALPSLKAQPGVVGTNGHSANAAYTYNNPVWLSEPEILGEYLEQQISQSQALGAIVGTAGSTPGSGDLCANAGKLNEVSAKEMTGVVFKYWDRTKKSDLMRFVRLNTEKADFLIYATSITGDFVLTMIYDTSSPLSKVRPQTKAVAQALATKPPTRYETLPEEISGLPAGFDPALNGSAGSKATTVEQTEESQEAPARDEQSAAPTAAAAAREPETQPLEEVQPTNLIQNAFTQDRSSEAETEDFDLENIEDEGEVINLSALLGQIPSPDPGAENQAGLANVWSPDFSNLPIGMNGWQTGSDINFRESAVEKPAEKAEPSEDAPSTDGPSPAQNTAVHNEETLIIKNSHDLLQQVRGEKAVVSESAKADDLKTESKKSDPTKRTFADSGQPARIVPPRDPGDTTQQLPVIGAGRPPEETTGEDEIEDEELFSEPPREKRIRRKSRTSAGLSESTTEPEKFLKTSAEPPIDPLEDTRPHVLTAISNLNQLEPVSPALSLLNYTCVLVPRLPQHYLTGEIADRLSQWVQQLCLAFGWRLEGISVRPEYLQWTLQVAPSVSPGNLVRIIRQRTSYNIFSTFTHLSEQNPSGDFWATGYLIVSGAQPPSAQLMRDYIAQTRKRQGINR